MHSSREELEENEAKIKEAKRAIEEVQREIGRYEALQESNAAAFADLKKRLLQYKKSGVQMPTAFVKKYKQFQEMQSHLESLRKELSQKEERMEMLSAKHHAFQSDILESRVICHDQWKGHNEIIFRLIEPEIEVSFVPPEYSTNQVFRLKEDEDAHFFIAAVES
jgi:chromosome segregation ATPase